MNYEKTLSKLAKDAIRHLRRLRKPIVRVSGPIKTGGFGFNENLRRLIIAQQILRKRGFIVFDYFEDNDEDNVIRKLQLTGNEVKEHYLQPILETGLITTIYMMPRWEESGCAKAEYDFFAVHNLRIELIPESWFR